MGLKILHSADWHLDAPFAGFPVSQRNFLKQELRRVPRKIAQLCRQEDCDLVLLSGDLFDNTVSRDTLDIVKMELRDCGVPVLIAPGNHDYCAPGSPWVEEKWPYNVFVFTGDMESISIKGMDCRIYGAGYHSMDCPPLLENFQTEGDERYHIAVLHGDATQRNSTYCPITATQVKNSGLTYLALGHIHKAGMFRAGNTLCAWPGCPMGRGWDETGEKGVCIVTIEDTVEVRSVSLDTVHFYDMDVEIGEDPVQSVRDALPGNGSTDFYRIALLGSVTPDLKAMRRSLMDFPNLELLDHTEPYQDVWSDADEDTLEGVYFSLLRKTIEEDPSKAKHIQLAAEISRKLLQKKEVTL